MAGHHKSRTAHCFVGGSKAWVRFFWVGVRWLVLSCFGVLALVNIGGLLALARVGSTAIVEANMEGWNLRIHGSSPTGASGGRTGQFWRMNGHYCRSEMLRQNDVEDGMA
jgi:hypothetical protein